MCAFRILLVNDQPFWQPGDWLEGVVELTLRERREVRGVRLKLSGGEHSEWTQSYSTSDRQSSTHISRRLTSDDHVLDTVFTFWGFPRGSNNKVTLEPGLYLWPFRISLPPNIAHASLENDSGHVRYALTTYIDVPWSSNIELSKPLHVVPRMPLSARPELLVPVTAGEKKRVNRFFLFPNGSMEVTATCGKLGFVPGDQIPVTVHLENSSGEAIKGIKLALTEHLEFKAEEQKHKKDCELATLLYNLRLEAHAGSHEVSLTVTVPPGLPSPCFEGRYIKRSHFLGVQVLVDATFTFDIRLSIPVVACSTADETGVSPDTAPSIFNPRGLQRGKFYPAIGKGNSVAPVCLDGLDYDPADQVDMQNCVRYPTFFSPDFTLPLSLQQYNPALYQHLQQAFSEEVKK